MDFKVNDRFEKRFLVSEKVYEGFVRTFDDRNPLHVDDGYAIKKGFARKVMHGNILNGFISFFIGECLPVKNVIIHSQEIRYGLPVYCNDDLLFEATIAEIHEAVDTVVFKFRFKNREEETVARGRFHIGILP